MSMVVQHNIAAFNSNRLLGIVNGAQAKSTEKLSSGYRINRAADDAAGLAISEKMRRRIRGLTQGIANAQDGVSLCQVADGALTEVHDMLQRINELSVKSANGTHSDKDRTYIQEEVKNLLTEIDRIGDTTTFNNQAVFKGTEKAILNPDGTATSLGDLSFADFGLTDVDLGRVPFTQNDDSETMRLQAVVDKEDSALKGRVYRLVYGDGSTSYPSVRITNSAGVKEIVDIRSEVTVSDFQFNGSNEWSRNLTYSSGDKSLTIKQTIQVSNTSGDADKNYNISYKFEKTGDIANVEFMFHVDTAYNDNDICEGYFIGGNRVTRSCVYSQSDSALTNGASNANLYTGIPDSLTIIDVDNALPFAEKISFGANRPDSFSIGYYYSIQDWSYYENLNSNLGRNTIGGDLGFSLYYNLGNLSGGTDTVSFNYGISNPDIDPNLSNVEIVKDTGVATEHIGTWNAWIQSGADAEDGMYLTIGEMNTRILGLRSLDVSTVNRAEDALDAVDKAMEQISRQRSTIGAQQNRMEHVIANERNIVENLTSAESLIRDTEMAEEMVKFANLNILGQAGQAILAQANKANEYILGLLQ